MAVRVILLFSLCLIARCSFPQQGCSVAPGLGRLWVGVGSYSSVKHQYPSSGVTLQLMGRWYQCIGVSQACPRTSCEPRLACRHLARSSGPQIKVRGPANPRLALSPEMPQAPGLRASSVCGATVVRSPILGLSHGLLFHAFYERSQGHAAIAAG